MNEPIKYISKVEIKNLWGRYDIEWNLDPSVNVLSGINGSGKSTVLECVINLTHFPKPNLSLLIMKYLDNTRLLFNNSFEVSITRSEEPGKFFLNYTNDKQGYDYFFKEWQNRNITFSVVRTFDNILNQSTSPDIDVQTELDKELYYLQKKYLDYQLNMGKRAFDIVSQNSDDVHKEVSAVKRQHERFLEIIDSLFSDTDKRVDRNSNELGFFSGFQVLKPYDLSSGEKQMLVILLTVLIQDNKPSILFMDEPEVSLHIDWQRKLIQYIKELNPNVQIILATHSPGIILEGWRDNVFEMSDLITLDRQAK
jgi:predicted ATP-dependent endonuclease of OLD family